jgi:hypothetical protein
MNTRKILGAIFVVVLLASPVYLAYAAEEGQSMGEKMKMESTEKAGEASMCNAAHMKMMLKNDADKGCMADHMLKDEATRDMVMDKIASDPDMRKMMMEKCDKMEKMQMHKKMMEEGSMMKEEGGMMKQEEGTQSGN